MNPKENPIPPQELLTQLPAKGGREEVGGGVQIFLAYALVKRKDDSSPFFNRVN